MTHNIVVMSADLTAGGGYDVIDYVTMPMTSRCVAANTTASGGGSAGVSQLYKTVVNVYLTTALCLVGFVGNGLSLAVLCRDRRGRQCTTNWLLQTLAVVDTIYLVSCLMIQPIKVSSIR